MHRASTPMAITGAIAISEMILAATDQARLPLSRSCAMRRRMGALRRVSA